MHHTPNHWSCSMHHISVTDPVLHTTQQHWSCITHQQPLILYYTTVTDPVSHRPSLILYHTPRFSHWSRITHHTTTCTDPVSHTMHQQPLILCHIPHMLLILYHTPHNNSDPVSHTTQQSLYHTQQSLILHFYNRYKRLNFNYINAGLFSKKATKCCRCL